ncbi:LLM class flavin-dependent oxidoreductase [Metabacillus sp. 84]|uniref:LLM class flavin-dependent oxidoreductase n=1 Tax=Metabacillus sp. 84 TaxID=3404705 RepID=UPI003CEF3B37
MKLSILDQSPRSAEKTPKDALDTSLRLAIAGEKLGYHRYWIAEHHDFPGLTSSAPEVIISWIGARTKTIRLGAGAILLPHYKPYKVAETFNLLSTLFPGRIDLGIGRSPGGSAEASMALSGNFLENVKNLPSSLEELLHFLRDDFPEDHPFRALNPSPVPASSPRPFVLGTSRKSAKLAAENGTGYAFGQFMGSHDPDIIKDYKKYFAASNGMDAPEAILAVPVICAETEELAEKIAIPSLVWQLMIEKGEGAQGVPSFDEAKAYLKTDEDLERLDKLKASMAIGSPKTIKAKLEGLIAEYGADEVMMVTITHLEHEKIRSYELIAHECFSNG